MPPREIESAGRSGLLRLYRADRWCTRATGLIVAKPLRDDEGLLIPRCRGIHTCGMRYRIGVFFLNREGYVISAHASLRPWRWAFDAMAHSVIETRPVTGDGLARAVTRVELSLRHWRGGRDAQAAGGGD